MYFVLFQKYILSLIQNRKTTDLEFIQQLISALRKVCFS